MVDVARRGAQLQRSLIHSGCHPGSQRFRGPGQPQPACGVNGRIGDVRDTEYGMREFGFIDADGTLHRLSRD